MPVSSWTSGPMPAWPSRLGSARNRKWKHRAVAKQASTFDDVEALRRSILVALLIFTTAFGATFAALNYFNANYTAMAGEIAMGLFALTEVISSVGKTSVTPTNQSLRLRDQLPNRGEWRRSWPAMLRGSGLGAAFGALPGTSGGMATFIAYAIEKRISKRPEEFGKGAIEGLAAPEACNNAGVGTAFIPSLTLGIPGDAVMALLLAAMMLQGIQPGPMVMTMHPELFWGLIASFWIGMVILVALNIPLIGIWVRLLRIPYPLLFPAIVLFTCIGVMSVGNSPFDLWLTLIFGIAGFALILTGFDVVPLVLGLILGAPLEENLRRTLLLSDGDFGVFLTRPIALVAGLFALVILGLSLVAHFRRGPAAQRLVQGEME